jgi:hypothetical protein
MLMFWQTVKFNLGIGLERSEWSKEMSERYLYDPLGLEWCFECEGMVPDPRKPENEKEIKSYQLLSESFSRSRRARGTPHSVEWHRHCGSQGRRLCQHHTPGAC